MLFLGFGTGEGNTAGGLIMRLFLVLAFCLICGVAVGGEVEVRKGSNTSVDKFFEYSFDGFEKKRDRITVHGQVKNISNESFEMVQVSITIKDADGNFLGRERKLANPNSIDPGDIGFHEVTVDLNTGKDPAIIEWSISNAMK